MLARIQNDLFDLGADLCYTGETGACVNGLRSSSRQVERLEREIDGMNGAPILCARRAARRLCCLGRLHLARTGARRPNAWW